MMTGKERNGGQNQQWWLMKTTMMTIPQLHEERVWGSCDATVCCVIVDHQATKRIQCPWFHVVALQSDAAPQVLSPELVHLWLCLVGHLNSTHRYFPSSFSTRIRAFTILKEVSVERVMYRAGSNRFRVQFFNSQWLAGSSIRSYLL
jgi:hypothetical protein